MSEGNNIEWFGGFGAGQGNAKPWHERLVQLGNEFPTCEAIGVEVHDLASRVVATFANESQADALITMLSMYAAAAKQWAKDEAKIDELSGTDEGHQAETEKAEKEFAAAERRANKLESEAEDLRREVVDLTALIEELRG